jgi:hypothetical protein
VRLTFGWSKSVDLDPREKIHEFVKRSELARLMNNGGLRKYCNEFRFP